MCGQGHHWATQLCDYQCSDGRWVATGAVSPKQWLAFCNAIDRDDLGEKYAPVATRAKEYLACKEEMIGECSNGRLLVCCRDSDGRPLLRTAAVAQVDSRTLVRRMGEYSNGPSYARVQQSVSPRPSPPSQRRMTARAGSTTATRICWTRRTTRGSSSSSGLTALYRRHSVRTSVVLA